MNDNAWKTLAISGCLLAGLLIFWPALRYMARGQWGVGLIVAGITAAILYSVWRRRAR